MFTFKRQPIGMDTPGEEKTTISQDKWCTWFYRGGEEGSGLDGDGSTKTAPKTTRYEQTCNDNSNGWKQTVLDNHLWWILGHEDVEIGAKGETGEILKEQSRLAKNIYISSSRHIVIRRHLCTKQGNTKGVLQGYHICEIWKFHQRYTLPACVRWCILVRICLLRLRLSYNVHW